MQKWTVIALLFASALLVFCATAIASPPPAEKPAPAEATKAKPKADVGMCMGIATRCGLLPKGACFMQQGCFSPAFGDRCGGSARYCTHFHTKSSCYSQQGCTWVKSGSSDKPAPKDEPASS